MRAKTKSKEGFVRVTKTYSNKGNVISEESMDQTILVRHFNTDTAQVGLGRTSTINLGDYNSVKVDLYIQVPSYVEELDDAYTFVDVFSRKHMESELEEINSGIKNLGIKDSSPL